ncbi:poly-gamma-glutamate biosynthesis protein PgsC [Romboutsia sp. 1001216sp1]|uniref:poly-gamma-glutamate biosynthesis protein PgsC n=1 Tax=unclassified Romboutsia TaxID=2626894 RepID=UPI00189E4FBE|nr:MULTISPECIES: poly-gamma-glutamate biosynthesis protein PgsC [unclassified Romboutsia]MDB8791014.1 poly-gamma-glutamate biosynthesis protein PgsC [Romboutsia sp. 1001216sp1]MDB8801563.1 poly-gamma-glutamate biosynthesis protein PgsC [Romboutsia sp. 1001216sp1]MDB8812960.1 poly-gamma-glutamate biosynthesis protein PgsC [Romboutsia sp. 1001216sp1]
MFGTDLYIAIVLGLTLSLIFAEVTGITPSGLIVPGYLSLIIDQPISIILVFIISILTYIIVNFGISKYVILYGRRRFVAIIIVGICLKLIFDLMYPYMPFEIYEFRGIGCIVPGLIAGAIYKQGTKLTIASTLLVSFVIFGIMNISYIA